VPRPTIFQRRFYVHPIQRKYLVLSLVPLILCCFAVIALTVLPSDLLLSGAGSEFERTVRASCLSTLGRSFWPAVFITMLVVAGLSVLASHTLGGPLYRLERIGKRLAAGELPDSVRIRRGDDLQVMAASLDEAVRLFRRALLRIQEHGEQGRERLSRLETEAAGGHLPAAMLTPRLVEIEAHLAQIQEVVHAFRLDPVGEKPA
jgi:HAMP domain-containing protein